MGRFFSADSLPMRILSFLSNLIILNLLFIFTSIPIITIGDSFTALYAVIFKIYRKEDPGIIKEYFKAFKTNFKQSTLIWIPLMFIIAILGMDVYLLEMHPELLGEQMSQWYVLKYPIAILLAIILGVINYIPPQIAIFNNPSKIIIKNSLLLAIANFPTTFSIMAIVVAIYLIAGYSAMATIVVFSLMVFIGIAALAAFYALFFRKIFNKILKEEDAI